MQFWGSSEYRCSLKPRDWVGLPRELQGWIKLEKAEDTARGRRWYWPEGCPSGLSHGHRLGRRGAKAMVQLEMKSPGVGKRICQGVLWVFWVMRHVPLLSVVMNFK